MGPDANALATISGSVAVAVKMVQTVSPGGIKPRTALLIALGISALALALWCVSQETEVTVKWAFGLWSAWLVTASSGLGILVGASAIQAGQGGNDVVRNALSGTGSGAPPRG